MAASKLSGAAHYVTVPRGLAGVCVSNTLSQCSPLRARKVGIVTIPPFAMLALELYPLCTKEEISRICCILAVHRASIIGELPKAPRTTVNAIIRRAKARKRK